MLGKHLLGVGLDLSELNHGILKKLLQIVHQQVTSVSKKYKQPVYVISESIVCSAAWAIAYCLLGPSRLLDVYPEYKDWTEEAEMELLLLVSGNEPENNNIYQQIFVVLLDSPHCHPEVKTLFDNIRLASATPAKSQIDNSFGLYH